MRRFNTFATIVISVTLVAVFAMDPGRFLGLLVDLILVGAVAAGVGLVALERHL